MNDPVKKGNWLTRLDGKLEQKIPEFWKFLKWMIMGGLSTVVEIGAHYLLQYVIFKEILTAPISLPPLLQRVFSMVGLDQGRGYLYTYLISITIGYIAAYILNRKVSFKSNSNVALSSFLYTLNVIVVILVGSWVGTKFSVYLVGRGLQKWDFLAKPVEMLVPMLWAYPLNRFVIFPTKKDKPAEITQEEAIEI